MILSFDTPKKTKHPVSPLVFVFVVSPCFLPLEPRHVLSAFLPLFLNSLCDNLSQAAELRGESIVEEEKNKEEEERIKRGEEDG